MWCYFVITLILILFPTGVEGAKLTMALNPNSTTEPATYWLFWGIVSRSQESYPEENQLNLGWHQRDVQFVIEIITLEPGQLYYFAATAADGSGNQSSFSNEVSKIVPGRLPPIPLNLRIVLNLSGE